MGDLTIKQQLTKLIQSGISFEVSGDKLLVRGAIKKLLPEDKIFLKENKAAIISLIETRTQQSNKIEKAPDTATIPLSFSQQSLWLLDRINRGSNSYNLFTAFKLKGALNIAALRKTFFSILERHSILRSNFKINAAGDPIQIIQELETFTIPVEDLSNFQNIDKEIDARIKSERDYIFNLEEDLLLRVQLLQTDTSEYVLLVNMHHIVSDGWSMGILLKELNMLYTSYITGNEMILPELPIQYADYSLWQRNWLRGKVWDQHVNYWKDQLQDIPVAHSLPMDKPRPVEQTFNGKTIVSYIGKVALEKLQQLCKSEHASLFMGIHAAFSAFLARYSNEKCIVVGSPVANRERNETKDLVGFFMNLLVLKSDLSENPGFQALVQQSKKVLEKAYEHQQFPFEKVVEQLNVDRNLSHNPLFQILLSLQNKQDGSFHMEDVEIEAIGNQTNTAKYDLSVNIQEASDELILLWEFNTDLFEEATILNMTKHFEELLNGLLETPTQNVFEINMVSSDEFAKTCEKLQGKKVDLSKIAGVYDALENQIQNHPKEVAVICNDIKYNFETLGNRITEIAQLLQQKEVAMGDHVGISLLRTFDMVASIYACFKLGAVYVPLDPVYSSEKIDQIIEEVNPKCLITLASLQELFLKDSNKNRLLILDQENFENTEKVEKASYNDDHIAYIIFTSGTTGKPKGIEITHQSLNNFLVGLDDTFSNGERQKWLAQTSVNFDISILELIWTISRGHTIVLQQTNPYKLLPEAISNTEKPLNFSVMFFGADKNKSAKYDLLLNTARYADEHGITAIWTPERHFGEFGGAFASPSVLGSALAVSTKNIEIRSGSVVLPLHDPVRVAEEWSIIDNLSQGRIGMSIASGWQPDDFVFYNSNYQNRHQDMRDRIEELKKLWKGTPVTRKNGLGNEYEIKIRPTPIQKEVPLWITAAGSPATFKYAGEIGANLLTHMLGQTLENLKENIAIYHQALRDHGHTVADKTVSLMLHTYIHEDHKKAATISEQPFKEYLGTSIKLMEPLAKELDLDIHADLDVLIDAAYQKFSKENTLIGSPKSCQKMLANVQNIGVTEIACLVDFGVQEDLVLNGLESIVSTQKMFNAKLDLSKHLNIDNQKTELDLIDEYQISHVQMTPSLSRLVFNMYNQSKDKKLTSISHWLIGGEAISKDLIKNLATTTKATFFNMYGPTETTIWSAWRNITQDDVHIGDAIFNTNLVLLDAYEQPVPAGTIGELYIGGLGLAKGYHNNKTLTAEKFKNIQLPSLGMQRYYKTGDLMRLTTAGKLEYIGRKDDQVKINGYRIEIAEVEGAIASISGVKRAKVIYNTADDNSNLSAYIVQEDVVYGDYKELPKEKQAKPFKFPDGSTVFHQSDRQVGMLYDEIITNGIYFKHGINLPDDALVLDIGANIGTFSIDINQKYPNATVIAFEPIPEIFSALKKNFEYRNIKGKVMNYGISDKNEEAVFNYYPKMAGMSGRFADRETILESIDQYIAHDKNMLAKEPQSVSDQTKQIVQSFYEEYENSSTTSDEYREYLSSLYETEEVTCKLTTVSDIINDLNIQAVDLLKLDVEKSECLVLDGIQEEHWSKIRQLAVEVDGDHNLSIIQNKLLSKGYQVNVENLVMGNIEMPAEENTYMLYASHSTFGQEKNTKIHDFGIQVNDEIINQQLRKKLPSYMIPSEISFVPEIPLMENGKVDRIKLKTYKAKDKIPLEKKKIQLTNPVEQKLYRVWSEVLKKEDIDPSVSIFEAGGNSIEMVLLHERLQTEFNVTFSLIELFRNPTISQQVKLVTATEKPKNDETVKKAMDKGNLEELLEPKKILDSMKTNYENDIAIIGMAGRFPKAKNIQEYWENLKNGVNSIEAADTETIQNAGIDDATINHPLFVNASSRLEDGKYFDADFFGLSNTEAILMDPQIRLLLQNSWHALEDAGYAADTSNLSIANYCGMSTNSYLMRILGTNSLKEPVDALLYRILNEKDFLATWISYKLNLTGPAMTVQTACSTSLVAIHLACQSLLNFECDMAMAGGVSYDSNEGIGYFYIPESIYARDGVCRPFDKNASGTLMGSGVATVVLKRAEDAIKDNDHIYGLIKGTAINNDGSNKQGYSTPSVNFQRDVILEALAISDINPATIGMIEAHGTGTKIGDPIEVAALSEAFREHTTNDQFCALGSVKANIGHLDAAAGVASLIKAVMSVNEGIIAPNINYQEANPALELESSPFYVNKTKETWPDSFELRRAGISSLGVGGTNGHIIVEQPPKLVKTAENTEKNYIISLSADTAANLQRQKQRLANYIQNTPKIALQNIAYTTLYGRKLMQYRFNTISQNTEELINQLTGNQLENCFESQGDLASGVFVFPGQGSQYTKMAYDLYVQNSAFKNDMDICLAILKKFTTINYSDIMFAEAEKENLDQTQHTQVVLFIVEYCLAQELIRNGIQPKAMIGHSLGEYVAACIAESITLEEALTLIYHRGRLMGMMPKGSMAIVRNDKETLTPLLLESVSICVYNATDSLVIGGNTASIDQQLEILKSHGISCKKLRVSHAYHTSMMQGVLDEFTKILDTIDFKSPTITIYSTYTGTEVVAEITSTQYWLDQIMHAVQFTEAVSQVSMHITNPVFIEVGPGNGLSSFIKASFGQDTKTVHMLPASSDPTDAQFHYTKGKALLHNMGMVFNKPKKAFGQIISLPGYAFTEQYFWKPQLQIGHENFEDIKASHHTKNENFAEDRLRLTLEIEVSKEEQISEETLSELDQIHKEYRTKLNALFSKNSHAVTDRIEMLYNHTQYKTETLQVSKNTENVEVRRGNNLYVAPETAMEIQIAGLWGKVLGYEKVGKLDNYFEMGGNSLLATQLINRILIHTEVELAIADILTNSTLQDLAKLVADTKAQQEEDTTFENELII